MSVVKITRQAIRAADRRRTWRNTSRSATTIDSFCGEYRFLSNFWICQIDYNGQTYWSTEAAYQAAKCKNEETKSVFTTLPPGAAKRFGNMILIRPDWDSIKLEVMRDLLYIKFMSHPDLRQRLLETGDAMLIEGNTWGDTYWGVCDGVGENNLGRLLMEVRASMRALQ